MKQNPNVKNILVVVGAIFGLMIIMYFFNYFLNPTMSGNGMYISGFSFTTGFTSVFTVLIQILSIVFVISLILSLVAYLKKEFESGNITFRSSNVDPIVKNMTDTVNEDTNLHESQTDIKNDELKF
jgi:hypothetical protein